MDKRKHYRAPNEVLKYFLDKHRDTLQKQENERRAKLKDSENKRRV